MRREERSSGLCRANPVVTVGSLKVEELSYRFRASDRCSRW